MRCALALGILAMLAGPALADPWKDESGKGRWGHDDRGHRAYNYDREYKAGIPPRKLQDRTQVGAWR